MQSGTTKEAEVGKRFVRDGKSSSSATLGYA